MGFASLYSFYLSLVIRPWSFVSDKGQVTSDVDHSPERKLKQEEHS